MANDVLCEVLHRLSPGVLYFQNDQITSWYTYKCNFIYALNKEKYSLLCANFHETSSLNAFMRTALALNFIQIRCKIYRTHGKFLYTPK